MLYDIWKQQKVKLLSTYLFGDVFRNVSMQYIIYPKFFLANFYPLTIYINAKALLRYICNALMQLFVRFNFFFNNFNMVKTTYMNNFFVNTFFFNIVYP